MARFDHLAEAMGNERALSRSEEMAAFVERAGWEHISPEARDALKVRVLDSLACARNQISSTRRDRMKWCAVPSWTRNA